MTIIFEQLKSEVLRLAQENPTRKIVGLPLDETDSDADIPMCFYNRHKNIEPCIFGQAFTNLGAPVPETYEGRSVDLILGYLCSDAEFDDQEWSRKVQIRQDQGISWGEAVKVDILSKLR